MFHFSSFGDPGAVLLVLVVVVVVLLLLLLERLWRGSGKALERL